MFEVQIWLPEGSGSTLLEQDKEPLFTIIKNILSGGDVGHANLGLIVKEDHPDYEEICKYVKENKIPYTEGFTYQTNKHQSLPADSVNKTYCDRGENLKSIKITLSAWPGRVVSVRDLAHALVSSDGMVTDFSTDEEDQQKEGRERETKHGIKKDGNNFVVKSKENINKLNGMLNYLKQQFGVVNYEYKTYDKNDTNKERLSFEVENLTKEMEKVISEISKLEKIEKSIHITKGLVPQRVILFSTTESKKTFCFDEFELLKNMHLLIEKEKYCFLNNNCAHFVRSCILRSMPDKMKKALDGLKNGKGKKVINGNFLKPSKRDFPAKLASWLITLEGHLNKLNSPLPDKPHIMKLSFFRRKRLDSTVDETKSAELDQNKKIVSKMINDLRININKIINVKGTNKKNVDDFKKKLDVISNGKDLSVYLDEKNLHKVNAEIVKFESLLPILELVGEYGGFFSESKESKSQSIAIEFKSMIQLIETVLLNLHKEQYIKYRKELNVFIQDENNKPCEVFDLMQGGYVPKDPDKKRTYVQNAFIISNSCQIDELDRVIPLLQWRKSLTKF